MNIYYGIQSHKIDVTEICFATLTKGPILTIPQGDVTRGNIFTDPLPGVHKSVFVMIDDKTHEFNEFYKVIINTVDNEIQTVNVEEKIQSLHSRLKLNYGSFQEELPEQKMAVSYLQGNEKVLEIGGNIGRNSLIIASSLNNHEDQLVVLETDEGIAQQLRENRDLNGFTFAIENAALSKRKLIQKGWDTKPSDVLEENYKWVRTIDWKELKTKYPIEFDTLVLDCEGAFYYILMDMPEILDNIQLIIMENDYHDMEHKQFVDNLLQEKTFYQDYVESGGWGPCYNCFFEVWKKK